MCCKLLSVPDIEKVPGTLCPHGISGKGCKIYDTRPDQCRMFYCQYLLHANIGEHWKPSKSQMVISVPSGDKYVLVVVDDAWPDIWRTDPFYRDLKQWAKSCEAVGQQVLVRIGPSRYHAIMPDRDIDLGTLGDDQVIWTTTEWNNGVPRRTAKIILAAERNQHATGSGGAPTRPR